ncbi:uncharacterized protein F4822DRAFT_433388 [Hypoxylon trugodes]|uniref:uncharacterized protein n=1 Tax=Hypoxylon trugodes TaxID=326681 RepID=UPI0021946408|nr:uncharacterized protein F4822DRAFT_433388 [Hypoxylon trugodes]KAI1384849.1 hypothetical protein F4822DRAFT_433388 [Hypoxylon trugodes]
MGRWGMRLFEGDQNIDIALQINNTFGEGEKDDLSLSHMIHQTDMLAPMMMRMYYQTSEYGEELQDMVSKARAKLDTDGLGRKLMDHWRAKETDRGGEYRFIIAGALLMRAGAEIEESDMQHLRELVPRIHCSPGYELPLFDQGFRGPGRAQFLAAFDNYKPSVPRNYQEPSCFHCGQVGADSGKVPMKCGGCRSAWYCDKDCQKAHWKQYKPSCIDPSRAWTLNV